MNPGDRFESIFGTGCGTTTLHLRVDADEVLLHIYRRWMGQLPLDVRLVCRRVAADASFGWLRVEKLITRDEAGTERILPLPDLPFPPIIEYLERPATELTIPADSDLAEMERLGYATWTERWHLLLWSHPNFVHYTLADDEKVMPEGALALNEAMSTLDKARFERVKNEGLAP